MTPKKLLLFLLLSLFVACAWAKPPKPPHHGKAPPPLPSPYAHIHLDMGHGMPKLDVDCGAQTPINECADVANALLTKATDMRPAPPSPPKP